MEDAIVFAKYLIKECPSEFNNTLDGNMKLQKILFFANMIHLSYSGEMLFKDDIQAFEKGCVVENVRTKYRESYEDFVVESMNFYHNFTKEQYESLEKVNKIFGRLSADILSDLTHQFDFWKIRYEDSKNEDGNYDQNKNIITKEDMINEVEKISTILAVYDINNKSEEKSLVINGTTFSFEEDFEISQDVISELNEISLSPEFEDEYYGVCYKEKELMVY